MIIAGVELSDEQALRLHEFLASPEFDKGLRPVLQKLLESNIQKSHSIVPKDMEAVYRLGEIRGNISMLRLVSEELRNLLSFLRKGS